MGNTGWHSDAVDGGLSSMDVLLQWLSVPGNVARWLQPTLVKDGKRTEMNNEIHKLLVACGITHRTPKSVQKKIWFMFNQFGEAEKWLDRKNIDHFNPNGKTERKVLRICPYYRELEPLLQPSRSPRATKPKVHVAATTPVKKQQVYDDEVGSKRTGPSDFCEDEASKRVRWQDLVSDCEVSGDAHYTERSALLAADSEVRSELFRLQIQTKRDEAICVRATARKELLELGFSLDEVDRLLPL